jgi:hypothetical protein
MPGWDEILWGNFRDKTNYDKIFRQQNEAQHNAYDPYIQRGQHAGDILGGIYDEESQDPTGYLNKLMEGYKPSEGYKFQKEQMLGAMGNSAAAGGMTGTSTDQMRQGQLADKLLSGDMQQWLNNVLGIQDRGTKGEQGFFDTGYSASGNLEQGLSNVLGSKAEYGYKRHQDDMKMLTDMLKAAAAA